MKLSRKMFRFQKQNKSMNIYRYDHVDRKFFKIYKIYALACIFSKVTKYTLNVQKSVAFLCTSNKPVEIFLNYTITLIPRKTKCLKINLPKYRYDSGTKIL